MSFFLLYESSEIYVPILIVKLELWRSRRNLFRNKCQNKYLPTCQIKFGNPQFFERESTYGSLQFAIILSFISITLCCAQP